MHYTAGTGGRELLAGSPCLDENKMDELINLVVRSETPVVLFGFSAGAYLCMRVALRVRDCRVPLALVCCGHALLAADIWEEAATSFPGVCIFGELEMKETPHDDKQGYVELATLVNSPAADECPSMSFGGFAGRPVQCARLRATSPRLTLLEARGCAHDLRHYSWALGAGAVTPWPAPF